jgi:phage terminase large subunit-like protein
MPKFVAGNSNGRPKLTWPNGAIATLYDAREPEQLRGPQHDFIWFDELAKYRYAQACFDQAMFGLRLGKAPRWLATTTPKNIPLIKELIAREKSGGVIVTRGKSDDNLKNLAKSYQRNVIDKYRNTRLGRQELDAEILEDTPGALWSRRSLDENRVEKAPKLVRVIVAVDPPATSGETANECGIVVVGVDEAGKAYVLDDWSQQASPDEWARKVVAAYRLHNADLIVAEINQGGEMVTSVIRSVMADAPVHTVRATRGKYIRAEPVSALYEQGRVKHVGTFATLEDQMVGFTPERAADRSNGYSPDRVDALVWGMTELFADVVGATEDEPTPIRRVATSWMG